MTFGVDYTRNKVLCKALRLVLLVECGGWCTYSQVADALGCKMKTARRWVTSLEEVHYAIEFETHMGKTVFRKMKHQGKP